MYREPFTHRRHALTAVAPVCVREFSPLSFVCVVFSIFYKERKGKAAAARRPARGPTLAAPDARAPGRAPGRAPAPAARARAPARAPPRPAHGRMRPRPAEDARSPPPRLLK